MTGKDLTKIDIPAPFPAYGKLISSMQELAQAITRLNKLVCSIKDKRSIRCEHRRSAGALALRICVVKSLMNRMSYDKFQGVADALRNLEDKTVQFIESVKMTEPGDAFDLKIRSPQSYAYEHPPEVYDRTYHDTYYEMALKASEIEGAMRDSLGLKSADST